MPCARRHLSLKVLTGELSPAKSNEMLEHFRRCGECREAFDFAAKTMTKTSFVADVGARDDDTASGTPSDRPRPFGSWPSPARRNRRTLIVFGAVVVAMMVAGIGRDSSAGKTAEPSTETLWKRAVSEGTPVVQAPAGGFEARPRVITALVPLGSGSIRVMVLDDAGRAVLDREEKPGANGCFVEELPIEAPGGAFKAGRLMTPFPDEAALPLEPGRSYGVVVTIGGGHASSSAVFQVARPPDGLHGAPK
jgi:hypothetical protein